MFKLIGQAGYFVLSEKELKAVKDQVAKLRVELKSAWRMKENVEAAAKHREELLRKEVDDLRAEVVATTHHWQKALEVNIERAEEIAELRGE